MYTVRIMLDFLHDPVWVCGPGGGLVLNPPELFNDPILVSLNEQVANMYTGYYEFNSHGEACWFNEEKRKEEKEILLDLITRIVARLNEINDGSFIIEDRVSEGLKKL